VAATVLTLSVAGGYGLAVAARTDVRSPMLPWVAGRALGLAAYVALFSLVLVGIWHRRTRRFRTTALLRPETRLRIHAALASAVLVLVAGHVVALVLDTYAGVGWKGAVVPGLSRYRTFAVGLGVTAVYGLVAVAATAAVAGRIGGRRWLLVHRLAGPVFGAVWLHGVLAGTDARALRLAYLVSGAIVALARMLRRPEASSPVDQSLPSRSGRIGEAR
jgi:hypothetical protein